MTTISKSKEISFIEKEKPTVIEYGYWLNGTSLKTLIDAVDIKKTGRIRWENGVCYVEIVGKKLFY